MIRPDILPAASRLSELEQESGAFSLLSYNVLLPNSVDGWWIYKYYQAHTPEEQRTWAHRQGLLKACLLGADADLLCLQETSAESFDEDFAFLGEAGYDHVLHRKFRFRNATFWRRSRFELVAERHKDKVLVTVLRERETERCVYLVNCHLTGGPAPNRRFRQLFEALDQVRKEANKLGEDPSKAAVVVCGDFNSFPGQTATEQLLNGDEVGPDFEEAAYPGVAISSKPRNQKLGTFADVYRDAYGSDEARPPTLVVPQLFDRFVDLSTGQLSGAFVEAVGGIFQALSGGKGHMDKADVEAWLVAINRELGRGSELRKAEAIFEAKGAEVLTREDLLGIYEAELREGKLWGVHHDLQVLGHGLAAISERPYEACLDRIYHSRGTLKALAVRESLDEAQRKLVYEEGDALPNAWHPSDHLPLAAVFRHR